MCVEPLKLSSIDYIAFEVPVSRALIFRQTVSIQTCIVIIVGFDFANTAVVLLLSFPRNDAYLPHMRRLIAKLFNAINSP